MVRNRHAGAERITEVSFAAPVGTPAGVEVLPLAELRSRARPGTLTALVYIRLRSHDLQFVFRSQAIL